MAQFISPGVYSQVRDFSAYAPQLSASITGIVGTATKGPTDQAILISSEGQLIDVFGTPRGTGSVLDYGMFAASEYLKAGNQLFFVRVGGTDLDTGKVQLDDAGSSPTAGQTDSANGQPFDLDVGDTIVIDVDTGGDATATFTATSPAVTGSNTETFDFDTSTRTLTIEVNGVQQIITIAPGELSTPATASAAEIAALLNTKLTGVSVAPSAGAVVITHDGKGTGQTLEIFDSGADQVEDVLGLAVASVAGTGNVADIDAVTAAEVKTVVEGAIGGMTVDILTLGRVRFRSDTTGVASTIDVDSSSTAIGSTPLIDVVTDTVFAGSAAAAADATTDVEAVTNGTWSDSLELLITEGTDPLTQWNLTIKDNGAQVEAFTDLSNADYVARINTGTTINGVFTPPSNFIRVTDLAVGTIPATGTFALTGGDNGDNFLDSDFVGIVTVSTRTGLQLFGNPEDSDVNVVAIPGRHSSTVINAIIELCELRGECFGVLGVPFGLNAQTVVQWHNGDPTVIPPSGQGSNSVAFNSPLGEAGLYSSWVNIPNKFDGGTQILVPPDGHVLRTMAFTINTTAPWFAPGGPTRSRTGNIEDLEYSPDQGQRDFMLQQGNAVNPFVNRLGRGITIKSQKTLKRDPSALDRINVRILLNVAIKIVATAVASLELEPNDPVTWRRWVSLVNPIFKDIAARRGLDAFEVIMDETTNTSQLIDNNTVLGKIFLRPTKTAEIIINEFNVTGSAVAFEDVQSA